MKISIFFIILFCLFSCASNLPGDRIPTSIDSVQTALVGDSLVRVIRHNMEVNPIVEFEIIKRPELTISEHFILNEIPLAGETLSMANSSGVYVESMLFGDNMMTAEFEYFPLQGEAVLISCQLPVVSGQFGQLICSKK